MEGIIRHLHNKIDIVARLAQANAMQQLIIDQRIKLCLATSRLQVEVLKGEFHKNAAVREFLRVIATEDFAAKIDLLYDAAVAKTPRTDDVKHLIDIYPRGDIVAKLTSINYLNCVECSSEMVIDSTHSVLLCTNCAIVKELVGTVFDDAHLYCQEGQKTKSGIFSPNRHFREWWVHILATESVEEIGDKSSATNQYGEELLAKMRALVVRDHKLLRMLTVNDVRGMLCELNRTDLNKNVPLILKKLTGVGPPQLTEAIAVRVENLFSKAIEIESRIPQKNKINRNYYPYYIYKILDQLLPETDIVNRRVLFYIYIQNKETVENDDVHWEQICVELPELKYVPTDRIKPMQYRP